MMKPEDSESTLMRIVQIMASSLNKEQVTKMGTLSHDSRELIGYMGNQNMLANVSFECLILALNHAAKEEVISKEQSDKIREFYDDAVKQITAKIAEITNAKKH